MGLLLPFIVALNMVHAKVSRARGTKEEIGYAAEPYFPLQHLY
jgi:hypothetical protein